MSAFRHDLHNIYCVRPSKVQMWSIGTCIFKWSYRFRRELSLTIDINHMMFVFRFLLPRCSIIFSRSWSNVSPQTTKDFLFDIFLALNFETLSNPVKFCPEIVGARVNEMIFCENVSEFTESNLRCAENEQKNAIRPWLPETHLMSLKNCLNWARKD